MNKKIFSLLSDKALNNLLDRKRKFLGKEYLKRKKLDSIKKIDKLEEEIFQIKYFLMLNNLEKKYSGKLLFSEINKEKIKIFCQDFQFCIEGWQDKLLRRISNSIYMFALTKQGVYDISAGLAAVDILHIVRDAIVEINNE